MSAEKGVSSWLTSAPSARTSSILNKQKFKNVVTIRYGFALDGLPTSCVCGRPPTTDHAFVCPPGGYPTARHNELRDLLASVLKDVVKDVETEPTLLPFAGENLLGRTLNRSLEA